MAHIRNHLHHYTFLFILLAGIYLVQGGVQRNLVSLQYLWHDPASQGAVLDTASLEQFNPRGYLWQAQDAFQAGNIALAEEKITPLITDNNFDAPYLRRDTMRLYAAILAENGNLEQALTLWRDIGDVGSLQGFAAKSASNGDLTIALQAHEIAHSLDPQAGTQQLANFLWRRLQEPDDAEAILRDAINAFPYSGEQQGWLHQLGQIYRSQERWDDAVALYAHIAEVDSSDAFAALQLGHVMVDRGDGVAEIMAQYQAAINAAPDQGDGYYSIGRVLARSGDFQMADQWYRQAVSRDNKRLAWQLSFAANARDLNDPDELVKRYKQIEIAFPEEHRAQSEAAWAYYQVGLITEAREAMDKALQLAGSSPPKYYADRAEEIYGE